MNKFNLQKKIKLFFENEKKLTITLIIISMLMTAWIQYIQHHRINIDSVLYFESAKLIAAGHWQQAIDIYNWPFYSTCIAIVHTLTGFTVERAAQLLNVVFFGITTASFLKIIQLAGGRFLEMLFGATLLFSARHIVGSTLALQIRDEGFWAFFLTALFFLIRFIQNKRHADALFWQVSMIVATLFRIEGIGYLFLLPLIIFFIPSNQKKYVLTLQNYSLSIAVTIIGFFSILILDIASYFQVSRLGELIPMSAFNAINQQLSTKSALISNILGEYLGEYAIESLFVSFIAILIIKTIHTIGLINLGLLFISLKKWKVLIKRDAFYILIFAAFISTLILLFIEARSFVIVGRYTAPLSLILLIIASFSITALIQWRKKFPKTIPITLTFLAIFISVNFIKNITPKSNKPFYFKEASSWLIKRNQENKAVLYDNILTRYYANAPYVNPLRSDMRYLSKHLTYPQATHYQYLMINFENKLKIPTKIKLINELNPYFKEIKRFEHYNKNKFIVIYEQK